MVGLVATALLATLTAPSATASGQTHLEQRVIGAIQAAVQPGDRVSVDGMRLFVNKACKIGEASSRCVSSWAPEDHSTP